ncbi:MAG: VTT domain-containing protein [Acidobacteriota bacterium]
MSPFQNIVERILDTLEDLGAPGIMAIAFIDSSFLSLPEVNDFVVFVKCAAAGWAAPLYAAAATAGSAAGASLLYLIGRRGGEALVRRRFPRRFESARKIIARYGSWAVLVPSILPPPLPFKIFVLSAGVFGMPYRSFIRAILIGRTLRYFSEAAAAVIVGELALEFFKTQPLTIAGIALAILAAGTILHHLLTRVLRSRGVLDAGQRIS